MSWDNWKNQYNREYLVEDEYNIFIRGFRREEYQQKGMRFRDAKTHKPVSFETVRVYYEVKLPEYEYYLEKLASFRLQTVKRTQKFAKELRARVRCRTLKEELMAAAWHPKRVMHWIEEGADDMMMGM